MTHFRLGSLAAVGQLPRRDLVTLRLAETEAPWGEAAENLRARFIALALQAVMATGEGAREAAEQAQEIMVRLTR